MLTLLYFKWHGTGSFTIVFQENTIMVRSLKRALPSSERSMCSAYGQHGQGLVLIREINGICSAICPEVQGRSGTLQTCRSRQVPDSSFHIIHGTKAPGKRIITSEWPE